MPFQSRVFILLTSSDSDKHMLMRQNKNVYRIPLRKAYTKTKRSLLRIHFPATRRRKGNLYKLKQSSTGTRNDLNKCDVEELIPEGSQAHAAS